MARKKKAKADEPITQEQEQEPQTTEAPSSYTVTYIVNGQRVDANGNPVKD